MNEAISKYHKTLETQFETLKKDKSAPENITYFIDVLKNHHCAEATNLENAVFVFGVSVPEEIIRALDLTPIWMLGGSFHTGALVEDTFPRDVDPVVRSSYGLYNLFIENYSGENKAIIPYHNDSFRKLSWLMKSEGTQVFELDIPSVKDMDKSRKIFNSNILKMIGSLEKSNGCKLKAYKLYNACKEVGQAKQAVRDLIQLCTKRSNVLSTEILHSIVSTYYATRDLKRYKREVERVILEVEQRELEHDPSAQEVWLLGSPIFFPNNKLISMMGALGAQAVIAQNENSMFLKPCILQDESDCRDMVRSISEHYYQINNMPVNVEESCSLIESEIRGVVFHILKGEVVYDYDLFKYEKYFKERDIPVLRIETDYSPEDKEQLKIRIEAFVEMLSQNQRGEIYVG